MSRLRSITQDNLDDGRGIIGSGIQGVPDCLALHELTFDSAANPRLTKTNVPTAVNKRGEVREP